MTAARLAEIEALMESTGRGEVAAWGLGLVAPELYLEVRRLRDRPCTDCPARARDVAFGELRSLALGLERLLDDVRAQLAAKEA